VLFTKIYAIEVGIDVLRGNSKVTESPLIDPGKSGTNEFCETALRGRIVQEEKLDKRLPLAYTKEQGHIPC